MVFGIRSPAAVSFVRVVPSRATMSGPTSLYDFLRQAPTEFRYVFSICEDTISTRDVLADADLQSITVAFEAVLVGDFVCGTYHDFQSLENVLLQLDAEEGGKRNIRAQREGEPATTEKKHTRQGRTQEGEDPVQDEYLSGSQGSGDAVGLTDEVDMAQLFHLVEAEVADKKGSTEVDGDMSKLFHISVIGGQWQLERTGRTVYGMRAQVRRHSELDNFCLANNIVRSAAFEYNKYPEAEANGLCQLFTMFLAHLYRKHCKLGSEAIEQDFETHADAFEIPADL
eukprot:6485012-Amphidinium_carterae.1